MRLSLPFKKKKKGSEVCELVCKLLLVCKLPRASLVAQTVKNLLAVQETRVQSLGWEDPLEKGMGIHSSILAWRIPGTEEPGGLPSVYGVTQSRT